MAESKQQQQLKEITERLEKGVQELFTSEKYMEYLRVRVCPKFCVTTEKW